MALQPAAISAPRQPQIFGGKEQRPDGLEPFFLPLPLPVLPKGKRTIPGMQAAYTFVVLDADYTRKRRTALMT